MTYENFKDSIIQHLLKDIPEPKKITIRSFTRNNGQKLDGLIILQNDLNIAPTIYLNSYFADHQNGTPFYDIYEHILKTYQRYQPSESINASFFKDFQRVRPHIVYRLINYQMNQELLQSVPHFQFLDLAIVFYYLLHTDRTGSASILIQNDHLTNWAVDADILLRLAKENTPHLLPYELQDMYQILEHNLYSDLTDPYPMFVLSNRSHLNGACCILYQNLLKQISDTMESDFYILPSSVHEVILIPATDRTSISELSEMVQEVNGTEVARDEVLSQHAYYYSRKDHCVSM